MVKVIRPSIGPVYAITPADTAAAKVPPEVDPCITFYYHYLSSKLYPVDVVDAMVFGVAVSTGSMYLTPWSDAAMTYAVMSGSNVQKRWFYSDGPYKSDASMTYGVIGGSNIQQRWFYSDGPYESDAAMTYSVISAELINKLVEADTGRAAQESWEQMQLGISINDTCSMDLI